MLLSWNIVCTSNTIFFPNERKISRMYQRGTNRWCEYLKGFETKPSEDRGCYWRQRWWKRSDGARELKEKYWLCLRSLTLGCFCQSTLSFCTAPLYSMILVPCPWLPFFGYLKVLWSLFSRIWFVTTMRYLFLQSPLTWTRRLVGLSSK